MAAEAGSAFLVRIGDGGAPEAFETVGGMRTTALTINNEIVDITNKDSGGWREILGGAGVRRISISGSGVFTDSNAERTMRQNALDGTISNFEIVFENTDQFSGPFQVTSLDYSGDHNGERSYSLTLDSAGAVAFTGAP